jgi:protoheme IX farnesyltransferase
MSAGSTTFVCEPTRESRLARAGDFLTLTKPRIAALELVAVAVAAVAAGGALDNPWPLIHALIGTALVAASASAWNQWLEQDLDSLMPRTADRPLPMGRISESEAIAFGGISLVVGIGYLWLLTNAVVALLALLTWVLYVCVYTPLKSRTPLNTAVGAVAGAMPALIGAAVYSSPWTVMAAALFMLIFLWQFPHFMAIAWLYRQQYAKAGMKMLPVVDQTGKRSGGQAVSAAAALVPVALIPVVMRMGNPSWLAATVLLSVAQFAVAVWFLVDTDDRSARWLLRATLIYLPAQLLLITIFSI